MNAFLILEDGHVFEGKSFGAQNKMLTSTKQIKIEHHKTAKKTTCKYRTIICNCHIKNFFLKIFYVLPIFSEVV